MIDGAGGGRWSAVRHIFFLHHWTLKETDLLKTNMSGRKINFKKLLRTEYKQDSFSLLAILKHLTAETIYCTEVIYQENLVVLT